MDFAVLLGGVVLTVLALPSEVFPSGWPFLGPLVLIPVFWFTGRVSPSQAALGGALWVTLVTLLSQFWLLSFHPLAFPLVLAFQIPWYAAVFLASSLLSTKFPAPSPWIQASLWTGFEFLRTLGFFSYPYDSVASTLWSLPVTFQSADLVGTSGLTFVLAWGAAWLAGLLRPGPRNRSWKTELLVLTALWGGNLGYGLFKLAAPPTGEPWRAALIQQSQDPWKGGAAAYETGFEALQELSMAAQAGQPDVVVWSETAFVPSVEYHSRYHENPESLRLVRRLEAFLASAKSPYLLGNDHREKNAEGRIQDYNAVLAWDGGWTGRYEKVRLVPFTESFPYRDLFPWVYQWLLDSDTHFWEAGRSVGPLKVGGVLVGTPICFEDAFSDGARRFSQQGARVLINLTNDSWAPGVASRMQHLSLAVFRSVETRLPLLRAANDGATASISSRGELLSLLPIGPQGILQADVRLGDGTVSLYSQLGDLLPWLCLLAVGAALMLPRRKPTVVDKGA